MTIILNITGVPLQPFKVGITVIVAVATAFPLFIAKKEGIFPNPPTANPIVGLLFVQL